MVWNLFNSFKFLQIKTEILDFISRIKINAISDRYKPNLLYNVYIWQRVNLIKWVKINRRRGKNKKKFLINVIFGIKNCNYLFYHSNKNE